MLLLRRLGEHFAAAAMSITQSRAFDAVCAVVPGCLAALADVVMRRRATVEPSPACVHLMGQTLRGRQLGVAGFGVSVDAFVAQAETMEVHTPELHAARTAVLDYFQSPQQRALEKFMQWETDYANVPGKGLVMYLRHVCRDIAHQTPTPHYELCDSLPYSSVLMKNFPELECFRDIVFTWKWFLNTDARFLLFFCNAR